MKSPFKFLDSYAKEDREIFFGREKEIEELYRRVFRSKIMLVYGVSGTGKSSLINCGLANKFQDEDWLPVNVRRGNNILESMYAAIVAASLNPRSPYSPSETQFRKQVKSLYLDHYKPVYFIFDQFEELFIFGSREEKSLFVRVVKNLVDSDILCKFIFVMREEYMASVTEFEKHIPIFFSNRVRIENMDINNAVDAIKGPCRVYNIGMEEGFPEALIENLSPGSMDIELTYLQVFLDKVFRLSMEETGNKDGEGVNISFKLDQLKKIGNVSDLLGTFLNEQIALLDDPDTALAVLKSFVSIKGTKKQMSIDEVSDYSQTLGKPIMEQTLLDMLQSFVKLRILRDKDQHERYELRHDSLATKIYEKISVVEKDILEIRQFIEDGYHNWQKRGILLNASDLDYIAPYESRLFLSPDLQNFIMLSRKELEKTRQRRRAVFVASTLVLLFVFAGFTIWALAERKVSRKNEIIANANYYNALSKELATTDPTQALRIAGYACKLEPSESNYQNLVNIYSDNEFYSPYEPADQYAIGDFKILNRSGNIAILDGNKIKILDNSGKVIDEPEFSLPQNHTFIVSPDQNHFLVFSVNDSLKVYDNHWNLKSRLFIEDSNISNICFITESEILIHTYNYRTDDYKLYFWSLDGTLIEARESYPYGSMIPGLNSDSVFYITHAKNILIIWTPGNNTITKKALDLSPFENCYAAQFVGNNRIALLTRLDSIKICDIEGNILDSWYSGDEENRGFYNLGFIKDMNLICAQNKKMIRFWKIQGQPVGTLRLDGNALNSYQYNNLSEELVLHYKNQLISYKPGNPDNELVFKRPGQEYWYNIYNNAIVEGSSLSKSRKVFWITSDSVQQLEFEPRDDRYYYKIPGGQEVYLNFPDTFNYNGKHKITIYNINNDPMVELEDSIGYPGRIVFSSDGSLICTIGIWGTMEGSITYTYFNPSFRLYSGDGSLIRELTSKMTVGVLSDDNNFILSRDYRTLILHDTSGKQILRYGGNREYIYGYDISSDNNFIISGTYNKTVKLLSRAGELLKVIKTDDYYSDISFIPGQLIFQVPAENVIRLYNTEGVMIQKLTTSGNSEAVFSAGNRSLYYIGMNGIYRSAMKIPVDSFMVANNYNDLSFNEKMEYNIITLKDLLISRNPSDIYKGGKYYLDDLNKKSDVKEIKEGIRTTGNLLKRSLKYDTLKVQAACRLTELSLIRSQYYNVSIKKEIDKYFWVIMSSDRQDDMDYAVHFYGATLSSGNMDSTEISLGYDDKIISLSQKILQLYPEDGTLRRYISGLASNISFGLLDYKQYPKSLAAVKLAIAADSTYQYSYTNLPLAYIFNDQFDEAVKVYNEWKDKPWTAATGGQTFRDIFNADLDDLEGRGFTHPDFEKARELLKK